MKAWGRWGVPVMLVLLLLGQPGISYAAEKTLPSGIAFAQIGIELNAFEQKHKDTTAGLGVGVFTDTQQVVQYAGYTDKTKQIKADASSVFEWGSATKLLVFLSVMQQQEQGTIDLDADIRTYLPENFLKNLTYPEPVTMTHLMNHTAGFQELYVGLYVKNASAVPSLEQALRAHEPKQVYRPGSVTAYSNWGVALAAYVVERVSGQPFWEYVHEHIFAPLGMEHSALAVDLSDCKWVQEQHRQLRCYTAEATPLSDLDSKLLLYPAGGAVSTLSDFMAFGRAVLIGDQRLLLQKTWELLFTPTDFFGTSSVPKNAHGFWMISYGVQTYGHGGNTPGCSCNLLLDREHGVGMVVMTNQAYEEIYNEQMPELVFGAYDRKAYAKTAGIPKGIFRTARTVRKGPLKWMSLTYKIGEVDNTQFWMPVTKDGVTKITYAYRDDLRISTGVFVLELSLVLLWGLALVYAAGSLLVQGVLAIKWRVKKQTAVRKRRGWGIAANVMQILALFCFLGTVYGVSTFRRWGTYAWLFAALGILAAAMAGFVLIGVWRRKKEPVTAFFLVVTVCNILYWDLYQFWG